MPCSRKGKDREPESRALSITQALATMLRARAIARGPKQPLFDRIWNVAARFRIVLERLGLDLTLTPYTLRHSSVIRMIRGNVPIRIIAFAHDTSVTEIERTYGRYLNDATHDLTRKVLLADSAPIDNVIPLVR